MPPKRVLVETSSRSRGGSKGVFRQTYDTLTSAENAPVVRSIAVFGVGVAILASSWAEYLLPPMN
ncbi:uncharacterized protein E0L32_010289 [Thyridium curvatum]|uniref:Uncharacterized protein n=1 Tax=Thyridium curvatum TaxID=1093900 RepID=A0A507AT39_9PEZI|nr:uncharacterized protein E0L32_010289 [Thyridium curvatum]TPX08089.1 hypothetical protein E0L32_010289 [Thyridium curvatum]